ncbi:hypothetical protein RZ70_04860 [Apilactobacillus kunkeei]|uniref:type I-E CRISPR-associated protein Cse1/CasA n=1 Tax=Apilactobacillus kunkeei TaxID=148814 RepID=UPI0006C4BEC4|nr:type I-E CRISPR-associated protein Cse1/CasA [Apilactobacillus kunkeei]KOY76072.1 hypothetical protein RZ70_04860 [Apilactobacillus kunkeei]
MARYNLLHEPWIEVIDSNNHLKNVSLLELFDHAHQYKMLAGDTTIQDFAILRLLFAITQTTFSRFDIDGNSKIDDLDAMKQDWQAMWKQQQFAFGPIRKYLLSQENKFYLYDDEYPFYQVSKQELEDANITKLGSISGKLINRLISESNNKDELFAITKNKNYLTDAQLARWIVTFTQYTGTGDKAKFPGMSVSASKGWLLGLGSVYLSGDNLFQTLMLNFIMDDRAKQQKPLWEMDFDEKTHLNPDYTPNNLSELYTNSSRLLFVDPDTDLTKEVVDVKAVQLPGIDINKAKSIEPMTLFQKPKSGKNKGNIIPKPHDPKKSLWRNFGLICNVLDKSIEHIQLPGVMDNFYEFMNHEVGGQQKINIVSVGMTYNHDASSMPNDEIYDRLNLNKNVVCDVMSGGLVERINEEISKTEKAVSILNYFVINVLKIRNTDNTDLADRLVEEAYFLIDQPFKYWLSHIDLDTDMQRYSTEWHNKLDKILVSKAQEIMYPLSNRDLLGRVNSKTDEVENVVTMYSKMRGSLKRQLNIK